MKYKLVHIHENMFTTSLIIHIGIVFIPRYIEKHEPYLVNRNVVSVLIIRQLVHSRSLGHKMDRDMDNSLQTYSNVLRARYRRRINR